MRAPSDAWSVGPAPQHRRVGAIGLGIEVLHQIVQPVTQALSFGGVQFLQTPGFVRGGGQQQGRHMALSGRRECHAGAARVGGIGAAFRIQ